MSSIAQLVREAGIVGAGGAGFPTHVKFGATVRTVIANGAECEPLLRCDKAVMRHRTAEVLRGLSILAEATSAMRAVIALKGHYRDVVARVREVAASDFPDIEVHELDNFYPAGDEQVLVNEVTGQVVPEGGIPLQVNAVVSNVITLSQVARAVGQSSPVTRRTLTVGGAVARPVTCEMPIGTTMAEAIERAGGPTVRSHVIIEGGPMMGPVVSPDAVITKRTCGVIVLPGDHPLVFQKRRSMEREVNLARSVCCQCRLCTDLCPRYNLGHEINPNLVMRALVTEGVAESPPAHITAAHLCCLCGVCEAYACPLGLSPRKVYGELLGQLSAAGVKNPHQRQRCEPHDFHRHRRVPLPRLIARIQLTEYLDAPDDVDWSEYAPSSVKIPLSQHIGAPATPVVAPGQRVREGDLIAEIPAEKLGARVHASIPGTVASVDQRQITIERN